VPKEAILEPTSPCISTAFERKDSQEVRATPATNAVESYKASKNGNGLRVLEDLPQMIERGAAALTPAEKELLKWVGVFFRKPTPGKFMMRVRMPNGFATSEHYDAPTNRTSRVHARQRPRNLGKAARRGPSLAANGHRQRPQHQWLRSRGTYPE
jgi:hypothetical protein